MLSAVSPEDIGERLRIARTNAGLTQQAAADALGMARTTIVAIEKGVRKVTPTEMAAFASLYGLSVGKLIAADAVHVDLRAKFRRLATGDEKPSVRASIDLLNRLATGAVELERTLGVEFGTDYPPPLHVIPRQVLQQAEDAAINLRNRLGLGLGRIPDPFDFIESDLGIRVFVRPLNDGTISGLYAYDQNVGACVLINADHPPLRRKQSLVHEVGHFVSDRSYADVLDEEKISESVDEKFARRFGPAFLMPAPTVRGRFENILQAVGELNVRELVLLSRQFDVTIEAMCRRLENLDLIASGSWEFLKDRGYSSRIESEIAGPRDTPVAPPLVPARLAYLSAKALEDGILSEGQLSEMLVVDRKLLRHVLTGFLGVGRLPDVTR